MPWCSPSKTRLWHWVAGFSSDSDVYVDVKGGYFSFCTPSAITSLILTKTVLPFNCQNMTSCKRPAPAIYFSPRPIISFPIPKYLFVHSWGIKQRPASQSSGWSIINMMRWCGGGQKTTKSGDNNQRDKNCVQISQGGTDVETPVTSVQRKKANLWGFAALPSETRGRAEGIRRCFDGNVGKNTDADQHKRWQII